ncbi:MAG: 50S ribosomal protein L15 [Planctomycetes bacterium]|nr:50S ribosomal protein L15 [Planctomycetota bacterium]
MMISDVTSKARRNRRRKRVGRGIGSGRGKTSTRGHKGMGQHSSDQARRLTEGGQMPLFRRLPKRGFSNARFRTVYQVVNLADLADFEDGAKITPAVLEAAGLIRDAGRPVKILGTGDLKKKLEVEATRFSESAARKITEAGGQAKVME